MVMGSSVASTAETTINTSTESASTLATNVTGTDTSTCDSLDLGKHIPFQTFNTTFFLVDFHFTLWSGRSIDRLINYLMFISSY